MNSGINRREFIGVSAAGAGALLMGGRFIMAAGVQDSQGY